MQRPVRSVLWPIVVVLAIGLLGCRPSQPGQYPQDRVTIICPWAPGGGTDRVSRIMADALQGQFGQPFTVVNKTGGSGANGHRTGAQSKPDGYTLTMITFELSTMHHMGISPLSYQDFQPLMQINADPAAIIVQQNAPWKDIKQLLDDIRANPGKIKMSGTATGGAWDLARAGMLRAAGIPVGSVTWLPNKGAGPSIVELLGGHIEAVCCSIPEVAPQLQSGELRSLGVMAEQRLEEFPDIPTLREQGVDWVAIGWRGLALPKGTPPEVIEKLVEKCRAVTESAEFREQMKKLGYGVTVRFTDEFTAYLKEQDALWKPIIQDAGFADGNVPSET